MSKVAIVYSETTANLYFSKTAYSQLFMAAQNQALMAGVPFDILTEADLKDLAKLSSYDAIIFPSFRAVNTADLAAIQSTLTSLVQNYQTSLITAGDFMTVSQTGAALSGDAYARMKLFFDLTLSSSGYGAVTTRASDVSHPAMQGWAANEVVRTYSTDWARYTDFTPATTPHTVLATQTVGSTTSNSLIANTINGDRNVHFSTTALLGDNNLLSQAIKWAVDGNGPSVGLQMTRQSGIFSTRNDMDQSMYRHEINPDNNAATADGIYDKMLPILEQWKSQYNFVSSYYINIGNNVGAGETTNWTESGVYYRRLLAMGNEIGSHSYTHPDDTNLLNATQIQFEFGQSRTVIQQQLGITITGAAVPGNPEQLPTSLLEIQYYDYLSGGYTGIGSGYPSAFGYLTPATADRIYLAPNITFDFTQIEWLGRTAAQAQAAWAAELADLGKHAEAPVYVWPIHDYGIANWGTNLYGAQLYATFIAQAAAAGLEFVTLDDLARRMESQEKAVLTRTVNGSTITASVVSNDAGKFALDLDNIGAQVIKNVTGWFAYDSDSVFTPRNGGNFTITLGASADDLTHIIKLPARGDLISVTGDGTNLNFSLFGEGQVVIDLKGLAGITPAITGATVLSQAGEVLTLRLGTDLITNGSFENPVLSGDTFVGAVTGWTNAAGATIDVYRNLGGGLASNGQNFVELDGGSGLDTLRQTIVTQANTAYELSVDLRQRPGAVAATNTVQVYFNNALVATVEPNAAWTTHTFTLYGNGASGVLEFREVSADNNSQGGLIDNVRVFQVTPQTHNVGVFLAPVNTAPTITSNGGGAAGAASVAENTTVVTTVAATDPDAGTTLTYSIAGGVDAARFAINGSTGALTFITAPNFETPEDAGADNVYDVVVRASDGTLIDEQALAVTVINANEAPVIGSNGGGAAGAVSVAENTAAVTSVAATDVDAGTNLTYSISGGADAALFAIDPATGTLTFIAPRNFEAPGDAGADNVYDVIVRTSDGVLFDEQTLAITLTNANEAPVIGATGAIALAENTTAVTTVSATDPDAATTLAYSIAGGADAALFAVNSTTGALSFVAAPNFEAPGDAGGDNVYDVIVRVSDGVLSADQALTITIGNTNEAPAITSNGGGASAGVSLNENIASVGAVVATDADNPTLTYSITGGADASKFAIDPGTGALTFVTAPNFEAPGDADANNVYDVIVRASDGVLFDEQSLTITLTNANETPAITSGGAAVAMSLLENLTAIATVTAADPDAATTLAFSISGGADAALFTIDAATGALSFLAAPNFEAPSDSGANGVYDVRVRASDGALFAEQTFAITVLDDFEQHLIGTIGPDVFVGGPLEDDIQGLDGADRLAGGGGADRILGGAGDDVLRGQGGADVLDGGAGFDMAAYDTSGSAVLINLLFNTVSGGDAAGDTLFGIEGLAGSAFDDSLIGNAAANRLFGFGGADFVFGGAGDDVITGDAGDDSLGGADGFDWMEGGAGVDWLSGGAGDDRLDGGEGNDTLDGQTGWDTMIGGLGNDVYFVDHVADDVRELAGEGNDIVFTSVSWTIAANVETVILAGADPINAFGSSGNDTVAGNDAANVITGAGGADWIEGRGGNDWLEGGAGADRVDGGAGNDRVDGGAGADTLIGGAGMDTFVFNAVSDSPVSAIDSIRDFEIGIDKINIAALHGASSTFSITVAASSSYLQVDINGDGVADVRIEVAGVANLGASDIVW